MAKTLIDWAPTPVNILSVLLAILFVAAGGTKLAGLEMQAEDFQNWGYPLWFMYLTGLIEVGGAILLFLFPTRLYGAVLLMCVMAGAVVTHARAGEWGGLAFPAILFLLLGLIAWACRRAPPT